ncbi:MAG: Flp family type IVb pilin [Pseudomonadota bacterium]
MLRIFWKSFSGSSAIEYAIIAGLISIAIVGGVTSVGSNTGDIYETVDEQITNAG